MSDDKHDMTPMASVMNSVPRHESKPIDLDEARLDIKCSLHKCGCSGEMAKEIVDGMTDDAVIKVWQKMNPDRISNPY